MKVLFSCALAVLLNNAGPNATSVEPELKDKIRSMGFEPVGSTALGFTDFY